MISDILRSLEAIHSALHMHMPTQGSITINQIKYIMHIESNDYLMYVDSTDVH